MSDVKLTYSQLLSSEPIPVGIGHIQPPKISDRRRIGEGLWMQYASYMTLTVDSYYSALLPDKYDAFLALPYEERTDVKLFDLVSENTDVIRIYVRAFCFYFVEDVVYRLREKRFEILKTHEDEETGEVESQIVGVIDREIFDDVLHILMQISNINNERTVSEELSKQKDPVVIQMQRRRDEAKAKRTRGKNLDKQDPKYDIGNIISVVCAYHPSINFTNVGQLTIPQLYDNFQRILIDRNYQIMALNASVWGTEGSDFKEDSYLKNLNEEK